MTQFNIADGQLIVGGKTLAQIENMIGQTPFYVYDKQVMTAQVEALRAAFPKKIKLHYAIKANPNPAVVGFMANLVDGFDVASKKEMLIACQTNMPVSEISFAGPGKTEIEISSAIAAGVTLHVESTTEIARAIAIGSATNTLVNIAIRVNPAFELKASGMKMAGGSKPFGIDEELIPDILKNLDHNKVRLRGFHIFAGSQNLKPEAIIETHQQTFALASQLINQAPVAVDYVNIGGGLGIPYFPGESSLPLDGIANNLTALLTSHANTFEHIDIVMELGRYLVGEAGIYVSKIIDKKISRGKTYLVADGGLHHHLSNSGNFGQVIRKNYPVAIGNRMPDSQHVSETVSIVGPLCTPLDILAENVDLPAANIGDYAVVFQSGAYGASASPQDFLGHPSVAELLI